MAAEGSSPVAALSVLVVVVVVVTGTVDRSKGDGNGKGISRGGVPQCAAKRHRDRHLARRRGTDAAAPGRRGCGDDDDTATATAAPPPLLSLFSLLSPLLFFSRALSLSRAPRSVSGFGEAAAGLSWL